MTESFDNATLVLHPSTPLAYLSPSLAFEYSIATYIIIGTLAVLIWDMLNNLTSEYLLLTRHKLRLHSLVYYVSRLTTLAGAVAAIVFQTAPVENCSLLSMFSIWFFFVSVPSTSLLFFFRVRALYLDNRGLVSLFFLLWLSVVGGSFATSLAQQSATKIGPSAYCIGGGMKSFSPTVGSVVVINDTMVFLAISRYLVKIAHEKEYALHNAIKTCVFGSDLPSFSKAFLQDGQLYYLTTIGFAFATTVVLHIDSIPFAYRAVAGVPNAVLMNIMACRVYRNTKLGIYREHTTHIIDRIAAEIPRPATADSPYNLKSSSTSPPASDPLAEVDIGQFFKSLESHQVISEHGTSNVSTLV
ncbi:hypothetical protein CVT25_013518 [Psilocybe cyanescens]|uniref:G-protein coupled receptors family 1 profile domain-containing protein n=1 Tax=Psilocybe cyanescens TaxID=93625 RepID=A0A409XSL4_PSICY|nr:hypothetical protein CVT25_013518 [Psilocybe cyanescens]